MAKFVCDLCGKSVASSQALGSHRRYQHGKQNSQSLRVSEPQIDTGETAISLGSERLALPPLLRADEDILSLQKQIAVLKLEHELSALSERQRRELAIEQTRGILTGAAVIDDNTIAYDGRLYDLSDARDRVRLKDAITTPAATAAFFNSPDEGIVLGFYCLSFPFYDPAGRLSRIYDATTTLRFYTPDEWEVRKVPTGLAGECYYCRGSCRIAGIEFVVKG